MERRFQRAPGVGVAVIDSGINDSHPDLWDSTQTSSRVVYHQDFTGTADHQLERRPLRLYGHGTHVAGIIGGNGYLSGGPSGRRCARCEPDRPSRPRC